MDKQYRRERKNNDLSFIDIQQEAHIIAFYPMLFQAIRSLINFGVLSFIKDSQDGVSEAEITKHCALSNYAASLLLDIACYANLVTLKDDKYHTTKLGNYIFDDKSIITNMDFMNDVCYQGAFFLEESFRTGKPEGLKVFGDWKTIYEGLSQIPQKAQESWFNFDNFYSDLAFNEAIKIVLKNNPKLVYDIGGNTAKFDLAILQSTNDIRVRIFDLKPQLEKAKYTLTKADLMDRAEFYPVNMLSAETTIPKGADAIWMSQFLDCFSPDQIVSILKKVSAAMCASTKLYVLEPFIDQQNKISALALLNTSLYFTCMANGNSRMYHQADMLSFTEKAGLKLCVAHQNIGDFNYTLLELEKPNSI